MKILTLLLFLFSATCFSQTATKTAPAPKPSATDCPTWGSKPNQSKNKAAYYEALRHKKVSQKPQSVSKTAKPKTSATHTPSFSSSEDKVMKVKKKE